MSSVRSLLISVFYFLPGHFPVRAKETKW